MSTFLKLLLLVSLSVLSGCGSDIDDAEKFTKPTVDAGSDKVYTLPQNKVTLNGTASAYPKHLYSIKESKWTQTSGPVQLAILNADALTATLINPATTGTYTFELYVKDSLGRTNTDSVKIVLTQSAVIASARSSAGYVDDYDLMWDIVAEDKSRFPMIEDQWHSIYQPYLIKAEGVTSDDQWQQLVTNMINEINIGQLELQSRLNNNGASQANIQPISWSEVDGIGYIHFIEINRFSSQQVRSLLIFAMNELSSTQEVYLDFSASGKFGDQLLLTLIATLATKDVELCLVGVQEQDCILFQDKNDLWGKKFVVTGTQNNKAAEQLANFIELQRLDGETFVFQPSLSLTTKLMLK